jgi:hypothetical protein
MGESTKNIMRVEQFLDKLWNNYISYTPSAERISKLFGERVINDHIAFRTFNLDQCNIYKQADFLANYGYKVKGDYFFEQKRLQAVHLENDNPIHPKIFLSELMCEDFSNELRIIINKISGRFSKKPEELLLGGRTWDIDYETYDSLAKESEYASWLYVWGFCPNHFTVSINHLTEYNDLNIVNKFIKDNGFKLNSSGGEIKGSINELLEQSSTMADRVNVSFGDLTAKIPSCYYEFAKRYPDDKGNLYQGFVAKSADKIFESTNK